ncbi:YebC/PmpR family DNA-binding transcriptional regulator [Pseudogracilibacillus auburnensis]|uniref:YebC/PmpR family DNA-binding transcriptional regulator n=1 Tax=Pseudogracilibacillus auburnensis TaxID=1494959 RepID=UPI001A97C2E1|nr:YebC/PmpR family DNA-binding transcriptional regulator [Pseudogracilibacillus auburnensis]MBO1003407.1 YebC/PmpR family DNA-binding transcriptional regulator [Pseudogracilibacillus auburnensis]
MAGHSKWHNIQRRKGAQDAKRGKIFMRHAKLIYTAAKQGGGDPDMNPALRTTIEKAKADNMPNDNIERAIKKATGTLDGASYEEVTYEGYGPNGIAVIVHVLTDNRNRAAAEVRHAFSKHGGNLGETGCVSFMFDRKGYIVIVDKEGKVDEDELTLEAIEAGAEDIEVVDNVYEIYTMPDDFEKVRNDLSELGYDIEEAEVTLIPQNYTELDKEQEATVTQLIDMLEESEDVQDVYHNLKIAE